jgi:glycosyltransferase involved in cell wall biosynthesis
MKNILILIDADYVGGAETNYLHIHPQLTKNGWNPVFVTSGSDHLKAYFDKKQIPIEIIPAFQKYSSFSVNGRVSLFNIFRTWIAILKNRQVLKQLISTYHPAAIISNSMVSHWLLSKSKRGPACIKIMHMHDIIDKKKALGIYGKGLNMITRKVDSVIAVSEAVKKQFPVPYQSKIKKIYNPAKASAYQRDKKSGQVIRIGMFARYTPWKGHGDFLSIAEALPSDQYEFVSFGNFVGNEGYYEKLKNVAASLPNAANIHLNGFCYDTGKEMAECDIILQLSVLPDPSPKIMLEANLCKVPVYAYEGGGVKELFQEFSLAGISVPSGDKKGMIAEIRQYHMKTFKFPDLNELNPTDYFLKFSGVLNGDIRQTVDN